MKMIRDFLLFSLAMLGAVTLAAVLTAVLVIWDAESAELTNARNRASSTTMKAARPNQPVAYGTEIATSPSDPTDLKSYIDALASMSSGGTTGLNQAQVDARIDAKVPVKMTAAERSKLSGVEAGATADQTGTEIASLLDTSLGGTGWRTGGSGSGGGGTTLPSYTQSTTEALFSRAGSLFWEEVNEVPNTPGTSGAIGHTLRVTGTGDDDYRWGETVDSTARSTIESVNTKADATRLGLAGLENELPDPPIPGNEATVKTYGLQLPASSGRAQWVDVGTSLSTLTTALQGAVRLSSVEVGTDAEYQAALRAQSSNNTPIILHVTAAISGTRGGSAYSHEEGDIFWVRPDDDTLIHLFTLPEGGGGGGGTARENILQAAVRNSGTAGVTSFQLPTDYATYQFLEVAGFMAGESADGQGTGFATVPTAWLAVQNAADDPKIEIDSEEDGNSQYLAWNPTTRTLTRDSETTDRIRIVYARLFDGGPKGEKGDPGSGVDQTARDAAAENAEDIASIASRFTLEPSSFTRDAAAAPSARTIIAHVLPAALPAGTTHLDLVIGGNRSPRVAVESDGAYTFALSSTSVRNISRINGTTTGVNIYFYNAASGGMELGDLRDTIRLVRVSSGWRALTGSSPYTIESTDTEFLIEIRNSITTPQGYNIIAIRPQLTTTAKLFLEDSDRPDSVTAAALGVNLNLNAAGTQLTATVLQEDTGNNENHRYSIIGAYAK